MLERFYEYLSLIRIRHWVKNLFLLCSIIFSRDFFNFPLLFMVFVGIAVFCLLSSAIYVFNDIRDVEEDKNHPIKKERMLPSGRIDVPSAWVVFAVLTVASLGSALAINLSFGLTALVYFALNIAYSTFLKHVVILDVFAIAAGFLLRVVAGAYVIDINPSHWLLLCSFLLAIFLGFCKRRHELVLLEEDAQNHRQVLDKYTPALLDQMIAVVTSACVICYILYTVSPVAVDRYGSKLIFTFPFVIYGIFRYLYLVHRHEKGGSPTQTLMMDPPLLLNIFIWFLTVVVVIY